SGFSSVYPGVLALATLLATTFRASWSASKAPEITLNAELIVPMSILRFGSNLRDSIRIDAICNFSGVFHGTVRAAANHPLAVLKTPFAHLAQSPHYVTIGARRL